MVGAKSEAQDLRLQAHRPPGLAEDERRRSRSTSVRRRPTSWPARRPRTRTTATIFHAEDEDYFSPGLLLEHARSRRAWTAAPTSSAPTTRSGPRSGRRSAAEPGLGRTGGDADEATEDAARAARRADDVAGRRLPRRAGGDLRDGVLHAPTRSPTRSCATFTLENFQAGLHPDVPAHHRAHRCSSRSLVTILCIAHRGAVRVLHGASRAATACAALLVAAVLVPLWASYLVKAYAWRAMLAARSGVLDSVFGAHAGLRPGRRRAHADLPLAAVHDPAGVRRARTAARARTSRRRPTSVRGGLTTFRRVVLPSVLPSIVGGSIFTFSLSLGDYIAVQIVGGKLQVLGTAVLPEHRARPAVRGGARHRVGRDHGGLPAAVPAAPAPWTTCERGRVDERSAAGGRIAMWVLGGRRAAFVYVPLAVVALNSFNGDKTFGWPPPAFTTEWWSAAPRTPRVRATRCWTSVKAGLGATAIALVLGALLVAGPDPLRLLRQAA